MKSDDIQRLIDKTTIRPCFKGWAGEDGNTSGRCCCNCKYQVEVMRHPWNTSVGGRMKGNITQNAGWGCRPPDFKEKIIFFEEQHSVCEIHDWKD